MKITRYVSTTCLKCFTDLFFSLPERKLGKFDVDFGEDEGEVHGSFSEVQVRARERHTLRYIE